MVKIKINATTAIRDVKSHLEAADAEFRFEKYGAQQGESMT